MLKHPVGLDQGERCRFEPRRAKEERKQGNKRVRKESRKRRKKKKSKEVSIQAIEKGSRVENKEA